MPSSERLPALRTNAQNNAITTTVYRPRQAEALELLPRFHRYAFQEAERGAGKGGDRTTPATAPRHRFNEVTDTSVETGGSGWPAAASSSERPQSLEAGPPSTSLQLFRPRPEVQQAAVVTAQKAIHRYRAEAVLSPCLPTDVAVDAAAAAAAAFPESQRQGDNRFGRLQPGSPDPLNDAVLTDQQSRYHPIIDDTEEFNSSAGSASPLRDDPKMAAAMRALLPAAAIAPFLAQRCQQRVAAERATRQGGSSKKEEDIVSVLAQRLPRKLAQKGEFSNDPNGDAVRKLFAARKAGVIATEIIAGEESGRTESEVEVQTSQSSSLLSSTTSFCRESHSAANAGATVRGELTEESDAGRFIVSGPATLATTLVQRRLVPHYAAPRGVVHASAVLPPIVQQRSCGAAAESVPLHLPVAVRGPEAGPSECRGSASPECQLEPSQFQSAVRWLVYDEEYLRLFIEQLADLQSPVPWLMDSNIDRASAEGSFPFSSRPTLHKVTFSTDAQVQASVDEAVHAYRQRLCEHRREFAREMEEEEEGYQRRAALHAVRDAATTAQRHREEQEEVLLEATAEKEEAFRISIRFRTIISQRLSLVEDEKRARLALLGEFASCTWPEPCRCLRWDAEILECSAVPLSPTLYPVCVYVSSVLAQYESIQTELLETRAAELQALKEVQEVDFIALYVFDRFVDDEAAAFANLMFFNAYCMAVAAKRGENVPARFLTLNPFAVRETDDGGDPARLETATPLTHTSTGTAISGTDPHRCAPLSENPQSGGAGRGDGDVAEARPADSGAIHAVDVSHTVNEKELLPPSAVAISSRPTPFIGPRDSPFCTMLAFVELVAVQSAAIDTRAALKYKEACVRFTLENHISFLIASASLELNEWRSQSNAIVAQEAVERERLRAVFEERAAKARSTVEERCRRAKELARIRAEMDELATLAQTQHTSYMEECLEEFVALHRRMALATRWAQLNDRHCREGTSAVVAARWAFEHEVEVLVEQENCFRQKCFRQEVATRNLLQCSYRVSTESRRAREAISRDEEREFRCMLFTDYEETVSRLRLQQRYTLEQVTLFGHSVDLNDEARAKERDTDLHRHCEKEDVPTVKAEGLASGGNDSTGRRACRPRLASGDTSLRQRSSPTSNGSRGVLRRCPTAASLLANAPRSPLEGAADIQLSVIYGLHDYLCSDELFDIFAA